MNYWATNVSFLLRLLAYVTTIPENYGIDACSERLSNYTIYLLDEDGNEIWSNHQIDMPNPNAVSYTHLYGSHSPEWWLSKSGQVAQRAPE